MKRFQKIVAGLLACLMLPLALVGCGTNENEKVIGTCGTYDVLYEELRFVTMTYKKILDATYGDKNDENGTIWDNPETAEKHRAELEEKVWKMMTDNYKVQMQCEAYGITSETLYGSEIQNKVTQALEKEIAEYGDRDAYIAELEAGYATEHLYRLSIARDLIKYKLRDAIVTDADKPADMITNETDFHEWLLDGNYVYVLHVMLHTDKDKNEDANINRILAGEVSLKLRLKEKTIEQYIGTDLNDDLTIQKPYYVIPGLYDEAIVDAAFELTSDRDATDVIEVGDSFYVLQRIEEPEGTLEEQLSTLFDNYLWSKIGEQSNNTEYQPIIVLNDYGKSIDLLSIQ